MIGLKVTTIVMTKRVLLQPLTKVGTHKCMAAADSAVVLLELNVQWN